MHKISLALLAAATACHSAWAQTDNIQVYGRLNTGIESLRGADAGTVSRLSNYRSVLGFKGSEDLGGGLKAIFQIEGTLSLDTGAGSLAARDTPDTSTVQGFDSDMPDVGVREKDEDVADESLPEEGMAVAEEGMSVAEEDASVAV